MYQAKVKSAVSSSSVVGCDRDGGATHRDVGSARLVLTSSR
jgi:hypothetical protein